jgi:energy-coupling factor transporter ATP-binding protein EcfA2
MSATSSIETRKLPLPFVGRSTEAGQLLRLHAQRKHVLILGPEGVGKSALIRHLASQLPLLICPESVRLADICGALEAQLGLGHDGQHLAQRKNRILRALAVTGKAVVFDGVEWTTPKLSSFIEWVSQCLPVWIATRSEYSWDIGHLWPLLTRFTHVELEPFRRADTSELIGRLVKTGDIPASALEVAHSLHRLSAGVPQVLGELLAGVATGGYDLHTRFGLQLLDLDRRIQRLPHHD